MGAIRRLIGAVLLVGGGAAMIAPAPGVAAAPVALEPVTDDSGVLSIGVPPAWTAVVDGRPDELSSGIPVAAVLATPDPASFGANAGPGVRVLSPAQPLLDLGGFLADAAVAGCTPASTAEPWQHPTLTGGLIASWTCGTISRHEAVANTPDGERLIWVQLNLDAADGALRVPILDSLTYTPGAADDGGPAPAAPVTAPTVPPPGPSAAPTVPAPPTAPPASSPLDVAAARAGLARYTAANPMGVDDPALRPPCPLGDVGMVADAMRRHGLEPVTDVLGSDVIALGEAWPAAPMVFCPMRADDLSMVPRASLYAADISDVASFSEVLAADGGVLSGETPPFAGEIGGNCYEFEGRFACWAMWHLDGLMLDVYVTTAPGVTHDRIAVDLLLALVPTMVANLAAA